MFAMIECRYGTFSLPPMTNLTIGRSIDCHIRCFDDVTMSRRHCLVGFCDGTVTIVDLESQNGTFVNEQRILSETELHDGDIIRVGSTEMVIVHVEDSVEGFEAEFAHDCTDASITK